MALVFWGTALLAHACAAVAIWLFLPGGFPLVHERFAAQRALPVLMLLTVLSALVAAARHSSRLPLWLSTFPSLWLGVAATAFIAFPKSGSGSALVAATIALLLGLGLALAPRHSAVWQHAWRYAVPAALCGAGFVLAQRAPPPSTYPSARLDAAVLDAAVLDAAVVDEREGPAHHGADAFELTPWLRVAPELDEIRVTAGTARIVIQPRLEFFSVSPDRFWTVVAPKRSRTRRALAVSRHSEFGLQMDDAAGNRFRVSSTAANRGSIEVRSVLDEPVYSHLNSFTRLWVRGHRRLGVRFSPCPEQLVVITHAGYPTGDPARFAYLAADEMFRVAQASSAEKGPFTTLGEGRLRRGEPLVVTLVELGVGTEHDLATFNFVDWSLQASTELSPTAGWGVPQNAVEFGLDSTDPASDAYIDLTLAGTSVGRGWDSVGHTAGVYLNRIELAVPPSPR